LEYGWGSKCGTVWNEFVGVSVGQFGVCLGV
jgi:hypothetical protein